MHSRQGVEAMAQTQARTRIERDSMGPVEVPADAYYGGQTMRAVHNFPISNLRFPRAFIKALGQIKLAAAQVNVELGLLDPRLGAAIEQAAQEVVDGRHDSQFVVDIFQTGSGTSTNMNANEVIANRAIEIRWLGSGPRAGIGEIALPEVQPGSSIMPGKVNPVIPESVCMVCAQVMGNDVTITIGGQSGNFEINVMMPVVAYNLLQSIALLAAASDNFVEQCIAGLKATERGPQMVERGLAICTALAPHIGYDAAAEIAKEAARSGRTIREVAHERASLSEEELTRILDPLAMTEPGNV